MTRKVATLIGVGIAVLGVMLLLHHAAKHGYLVDYENVMNHEFFVAMFTSLGVGLIVGGISQA